MWRCLRKQFRRVCHPRKRRESAEKHLFTRFRRKIRVLKCSEGYFFSTNHLQNASQGILSCRIGPGAPFQTILLRRMGPRRLQKPIHSRQKLPKDFFRPFVAKKPSAARFTRLFVAAESRCGHSQDPFVDKESIHFPFRGAFRYQRNGLLWLCREFR